MSLGLCPHAAARRRDTMPAKMIGNGLRELDLFLTDLIVEAQRVNRLGADAGIDPGVHPGRRIFSAAEAWRRAAAQLGLAGAERGRLREMRAAQNRQCFGRLRGLDAEAAMVRDCGDYARLAGDVLAAVGGKLGRGVQSCVVPDHQKPFPDLYDRLFVHRL